VAKLQVPEPGTPLKESGIWYPEIPRYPVCLNEEILPNIEFYSTGYFPLFWVPFGGAGGKDLELLTSIQITMVDGIWGIEFSYCDGREVGKLGRHPYDIDLNPEVPNISTFEIDGPHGERISSISLWYDSDTFVQGQINKPCGISVSFSSLFFCGLILTEADSYELGHLSTLWRWWDRAGIPGEAPGARRGHSYHGILRKPGKGYLCSDNSGAILTWIAATHRWVYNNWTHVRKSRCGTVQSCVPARTATGFLNKTLQN
jgi:hypothetical protein